MYSKGTQTHPLLFLLCHQNRTNLLWAAILRYFTPSLGFSVCMSGTAHRALRPRLFPLPYEKILTVRSCPIVRCCLYCSGYCLSKDEIACEHGAPKYIIDLEMEALSGLGPLPHNHTVSLLQPKRPKRSISAVME